MRADFNHDGFTDLAAGAPGEKVSAFGAAGAVSMLYGSAGGLYWIPSGGPDHRRHGHLHGLRVRIGFHTTTNKLNRPTFGPSGYLFRQPKSFGSLGSQHCT